MSTGDDESKGSETAIFRNFGSDLVGGNKAGATPELKLHASLSEERPLVTVTAEHVSFCVPARHISQQLFPHFFTNPPRDSNITFTTFNPEEGCELLRDINFMARPYELTAIIGPSGCGKTTFMNILAHRAIGTVSGTVAYNNVVASARNLKGCVSMCYANDRLLPYLTVEETLYFATILKMGQKTAKERRERVDEVLKEMALDHVRYIRVGGKWNKGLSSGEVRRTAIAVELIGDPAVLLLDEPTSGLDAVLAFEIMFVLKSLALQGRTIICAIHQPRVAIFEMFDGLMVMACGRSLYHGAAKLARDYMTNAAPGKIATRINTADALIDLVSGPREEILSLTLAFENSSQYSQLSEDIMLTRSVDNAGIRFAERNPYIQWFVEVGAVCFRNFRNSMRNPLSFTVLLIIQILMGLFLGGLFYKLPQKFLPDEVPPEASDPQGPLFKLFNQSMIVYANTGIDQTGYNPLLELLISGPDGNMSEPFMTLLNTSVPRNLYNNLICAHEQLELDLLYEDVEFEQYKETWSETGEGDDLYAGGSSGSPVVLTSYVLKSLQVLDYLLTKFKWTHIIMLYELTNNDFITAQVACKTDIRELAGIMSGCQGLTPTPVRRFTKGETSFTFNMPCTWGSSAVEPDPAADTRFSSSSRVYALSTDLNANADFAAAVSSNQRSKRRRLQASALLTGGGGDLTKALPPVLRQIVARAPAYVDAFSKCEHEACKLISGTASASSTDSGSIIQVLAQYGSVLGAVMNVVGALFFSTGNAGFASYDALVAIPQDRAMINREMANNYYKPSSYFVGRNIADYAFQIVPTFFLLTTFFFLVGVNIGEHGYYFWRYLGICALTIWAAYGFSYLVSAASPNLEVSIIAASLLLVILCSCAGFFVRDSALPVWMSWIKYLSYYRWGFFGLVLNQFPKNESYFGLPNSFSLAMIGVSETRMWVICVALFVLGVGFRVLAYFAIKYLHRRIGIEQ